jgi:NTP pyrophosphatase (non-canonical NTP hydrolase)
MRRFSPHNQVVKHLSIANPVGLSKANTVELGMEKYDLSNPFNAIRAEVARARKLHPGNHHLFLALVEEVGEIAEAMQRGDSEHARQEAVQVACLAVRLIEENDASWFSAKSDEKPPESTLKT